MDMSDTEDQHVRVTVSHVSTFEPRKEIRFRRDIALSKLKSKLVKRLCKPPYRKSSSSSSSSFPSSSSSSDKSGQFEDIKLFQICGSEIRETDDLISVQEGSHLFLGFNEPYNGEAALQSYEILEKVGEGGYGEVMKARSKLTKEVVAMKYIKMSNMSA